jgi:hypothetical protein
MKQVIKINASSLPYMLCELKWYRIVIEGYKEPRSSAKIIYGVAIHKFIDSMFQSGGDVALSLGKAEAAFNVPKYEDRQSKHINDWKHCCGTCFQYWSLVLSKEKRDDHLQMPNGKPATEVTFEILYYEDDQFEVWLCGTIDKLVKIRNGCYAIGDYKSTSQSSVESYLDSYAMSHQLRFYMLSLKIMAEKEPESMLGKLGATRLGAFIDGLFIRPVFSENEYHRSKVFMYSDGDLQQFKWMLNNKIEVLLRLLRAVRDGDHPYKEGLFNGSCFGKFSTCEFYGVCRADNPAIEQTMLKRDFVQKTYDPLHHND